jgi:hypothetical protein
MADDRDFRRGSSRDLGDYAVDRSLGIGLEVVRPLHEVGQ